MVDPSRQFWIAAVLLPALGLCSSCASQVPDGELPCDSMAKVACPSYVPVCEQRPRDAAAFCYRDAQPGVARQPGARRQPVPMPASRSYRLIEQRVAKSDGSTLVAGR